MQEFNSEVVLRLLQDGFRQSKLNQALRRHWAQYVPSVFTTKPDADTGREERKAEKFLFKPMESFICNGDPGNVFKQLKEKDNPPQLCGKVFKMGEPTYSCRDCGMDPTCVLCIDCFQKSVHKKHRYKMSTSGGGGYCDCGDQEAWRTEPFCDSHKQGLDQQEDQNPMNSLPADLRERATQVFLCAMNYAATMLLWTKPVELPEDLRPPDIRDTHITMLFNDEVHTYDQVIDSLKKAVGCSHKEAVDFATTVDRDGRSPVRFGSYDDCTKALHIIERQTSRASSRPLKVVIMHTSVVAHQQFATKILTWLQQVIAQSAGLRQLFCCLSMQPQDADMTIVERMMLADTKLWKSCRIQSHQLFMSGILMDSECKKQFAVLFTKIYTRLMQNFIEDDHDHSVCAVAESVQIFTVPTLNYEAIMGAFIEDDHYRSVSITSTTVQLYTVPTLARMLIMDYNLLHVILSAFLKECESKKNRSGKFAFERQANMSSFRRAQYMLYDVKYSLTCKPSGSDEWNDGLRTNFLQGARSMLQLLQAMQGMDAVTRQTGQHIEFEPEWEGAFNLQLKLEDIICIMLDWSGTDSKVLCDVFAAAIQTLGACREECQEFDYCTVADHRVACIKYDVSSQPVSIHQPVSRFLAGLFPHLNRLNIGSLGMGSLTTAQLLEPSLRCQVLVAQTQAGMWRRNGYSLLNQIYFYHNVRCRTQMYDKDILLLQACAALTDSDEFLVHVIHKFGLAAWARPDYDRGSQDDVLRQIVMLVEELLTLLITILGERYIPGVGEVSSEDQVKRELIHQLCIQDMAHSELVKALPEDPYHETGIDNVVQEVATFKKPTGTSGKGMYELKADCVMQYNPFFYHYTRSEQSKSEEAQRKRKKLANEDQALPPPVPPPFVAGFASIASLLHCDVMLHLMTVVLSRVKVRWSRSWSDAQLERVLHLIGLALHEERRAHERGDVNFCFVRKATSGDPSVFCLLESLVGHAHVTHEAQKDLLAWVISTFTSVRQLRDESFTRDANTGDRSQQDELAERERQAKADKAAKRRTKIMDKMSKMQRNFIEQNSELFEQTPTELQPAGLEMDISQPVADDSLRLGVAIGPKRSVANVSGLIRQTCILCQEEQDVKHNDRAMVLSAFVQKSTVLSRSRGKCVEEPELHDPLFMPSDLVMGAHTSTCGHVMHADCWQRFYDAILVKERRRALRFRSHTSYDIEKREFLCPLCECLSNTVIPIIPHLCTLMKDREKKEVDLSLNDWLDGIQKTVKNSIQQAKDKESSEEESFLFVPCPLSGVTKMMAESVAKNFQILFDYVYDDASAHFSDSLTTMLRKFSTDVYAIGLGVHPDDEDARVPVMAWSTCAYTITVIEHGLRHEGKPLFGALPSRQADCLAALVRFSAVCSQVIQQELVKKHCVTLLSALLCDSAYQRLQETPNVLDIEPFHYMVMLCLSLPTLYAEDDPTASQLTRIPTAGLNDLHAAQLALTAHVVQIILTMDVQEEESMETESDADAEKVLKIFSRLRELAGLDGRRLPSSWQLITHLKAACLPFLRCCSIFFHYMTGVSPPEKLMLDNTIQEEEFDLLCRYLSLPVSMSQLFDQGPVMDQLIHSWCKDESVRAKLAEAGAEPLVTYPMTVNNLISLPEDYSELINKISTFTCPKSDGDDSRAPTMCLVCGQILCSQSYCCQTELGKMMVGAATAHVQTCGAGTGIFLRVRECQVLLLNGLTKGCFFAPPYLDDYGETDQGLRRGNPLHLCVERYRKLQKLWQSHCIPEEIVHLLETNSNLLSIDWQHL